MNMFNIQWICKYFLKFYVFCVLILHKTFNGNIYDFVVNKKQMNKRVTINVGYFYFVRQIWTEMLIILLCWKTDHWSNRLIYSVYADANATEI